MRRVVFGAEDGAAGSVLSDGPPPTVHDAASLGLPPGSEWAELWLTRDDVISARDATIGLDGFVVPGPGEVAFKSGVFPPTGRPEIMHATDTIDYVTVISGSIEVGMEDGSRVLLHAGDTAVQAGGIHQWFNPGDVACEISVVMVGARRA